MQNWSYYVLCFLNFLAIQRGYLYALDSDYTLASTQYAIAAQATFTVFFVHKASAKALD